MEKYEEGQIKEEGDLNKIATYLEKNNGNDIQVDNREKVNPPKLAEGMIPIKYVNENWVITNEEDIEWYDYSEGKMLWANVMLSDGTYKTSEKNYKTDGSTVVEEKDLGSMFVWIPRYAYSFNKYHTEMDNGEGTTQRITNVVFLNGTSNRDYKNNNYQTTYEQAKAEKGKATPMIVHPGFTFGGIELSGIWVGKFEASMSGKNENTKETNNMETNNTTSDTHSVKVLPNADTWRYIGVGNSFFNCLNMNGDNNIYGIKKSETDTHLMKNIEWGAVSYLVASQYGSMPTINEECQNSSGIYHVNSGENDYETNTSQSTTRNVTGIYDMNGGAWEWEAAYYDNLDSNLSINGLSAFVTTNIGVILNSQYEKYWDKYEVGTTERTVTKELEIWRNWTIWNGNGSNESNQKRKDITKKRYELMESKIGDGMYEVIKNYSYFGKTTNGLSNLWIANGVTSTDNATFEIGYYNGDCTLIGNCDQPFLQRGGRGNSFDKETGKPSPSGIFTSVDAYGEGHYVSGFRPVLII